MCNRENNECHHFYPGHKHYIDWNMCDPELVDDLEDRLFAMRVVRDLIRAKVEAFIAGPGETGLPDSDSAR